MRLWTVSLLDFLSFFPSCNNWNRYQDLAQLCSTGSLLSFLHDLLVHNWLFRTMRLIRPTYIKNPFCSVLFCSSLTPICLSCPQSIHTVSKINCSNNFFSIPSVLINLKLLRTWQWITGGNCWFVVWLTVQFQFMKSVQSLSSPQPRTTSGKEATNQTKRDISTPKSQENAGNFLRLHECFYLN